MGSFLFRERVRDCITFDEIEQTREYMWLSKLFRVRTKYINLYNFITAVFLIYSPGFSSWHNLLI
ncbi:hypothetical protein RhiirC2_758618 [Rhizophagus irregularis]|uniref:Uncharacterized protein n=1 Tax=Rhizophagus irregularis TaxID=588596 RepID=A0A2N1MNG3_9GLOM|nr:hypothetical protein RhiirC2_758618 [Rhizophagus irregularis]